MKKFLIPLFLVFFGFTIPLSNGPILTVTGDGTPGSTVNIDVVEGSPDAPIAVFASFQNDGIAYATPWGTIEFDIGPRLILLTRDVTDANGDFHYSFDLPYFKPQLDGKTVYFQTVEAVVDWPDVTFNTSNVAELVLHYQ